VTAKELLKFIQEHIPTFADARIVGPGKGYHYTSHFGSIKESGKFLGAPMDKNLDKTQVTWKSPPAKHDPGVVFAYPELRSAREEASGDPILEIEFLEAVLAVHVQEASCGGGPTLLIPNRNIDGFRQV